MGIQSYEILTGVGALYVANTGTAFPAVDATPGASWTFLGETVDGVTISYDEDIEEIMVDQETGPVKAIRTSEHLNIETNLAKGTLENLAFVLGNTVTTVAAGTGNIGTKEVPSYRGAAVVQKALLFRGSSPYGASFPAQFEVPIGYFGGEVGLEFTKDGVTTVPVAFHALVDPGAATDDEKFGRYIAQSAAAL